MPGAGSRRRSRKLLSTSSAGPAGFAYRATLQKAELRRHIFALYVDDICVFEPRLDELRDVVSGLVITAGSSASLVALGPRLWHLVWDRDTVSEAGLQAMVGAMLEIIDALRDEGKRYQLLQIEQQRSVFQQERMAEFYAAARTKMFADLREQHKWTSSALGALVTFVAGPLQEADIDRFPALLVSFLAEASVGYPRVGWLKREADRWHMVAEHGAVLRVSDADVEDLEPWKPVQGGDFLLMLMALGDEVGDGADVLAVGSDMIGYEFSEYEFSFFRLFGSLINALYRLRVAQQATQQARERAEAANRAKSEFLANISHELRTPINGVLGSLQLLEQGPLNNEQCQYVEVGMSAGNGLLLLVNDILDLSRIEARQLRLVRQPFDLIDLVDTVGRTFLLESAAKNIVVSTRFAPQTPRYIVGDPGRLRQILFNVVGNAVKFTDAGQISVDVDCRERGDDYMLTCRVRDTGIGIAPEKLQTILEAFTQVDGSSKRKYQGSGLGLNIVSRLVHIMGGEIEIDSRVSVGTTVTFSIQVGIAEADMERSEHGKGISVHTRGYVHNSNADSHITIESAPRDESESHHLKILLVEDQELNQIVARRLLEREGHKVVLARNGRQAVQAAMTYRFDCILMDIQMPEMDGIEATKLIRQHAPRGQRLPIIAFTAHAMKGDRDHFLAQGMDSYLPKPFNTQSMQIAIAEAMEVRARMGTSP